MSYIIKEPHDDDGPYFYYGDEDVYEDMEDVKDYYNKGSEVVVVDTDYDDLSLMDQEELEEEFNKHNYKP